MADQLHIKHYDSLDMFLFSFNPQVSQAPAGGVVQERFFFSFPMP